MEILLILLIIYIIGCVLAYGRVKASFYEIHERYIKSSIPFGEEYFIIYYSLLSYITFYVGVVRYFRMKEKYFLKFSYKPLIDKYYKQKE